MTKKIKTLKKQQKEIAAQLVQQDVGQSERISDTYGRHRQKRFLG
jgi:hypothetical protein